MMAVKHKILKGTYYAPLQDVILVLGAPECVWEVSTQNTPQIIY